MNNSNNGRCNFIKHFEIICDSNKDKTAVTYMLENGDKDLFSFKSLREKSKNLAEKLKGAGLIPGDRVAILSVLSPYCYISYFAFAYAGLTSVIIDPQLPKQEKDRLLENADIRGIITSEAQYEEYTNRFDKDMPVINIKDGCFYSNIERSPKNPTSDPDIDAAAILYSSGTTSQAKGVVIGFEQQLKAIFLDLEFVGTNKIRWLEVYPFFHISGLSSSLAILLNGAEIGLIENVSAVKLQQAFQKYRPNTFALVPKVFEVFEGKIKDAINTKGHFVAGILFALMKLSGFTRKHFNVNIGKKLFRSVNKQVFGGNMIYLGVGGGLSNPKTIEFFYQLGYVWFNMYASTEANVPITSVTYKDKYPVYSSGRVDRFEGINIKIHEPDKDGIGEIRVKTVLIMKGYFRDPELTTAAFDEDGYFKTGDLGYVNKKNELIITGRAKEIIYLHNGEKVSPEDIERYYKEIIGELPFACAGVLSKNRGFDITHLFIERNELTANEQKELIDKLVNYSSNTSPLYQVSDIHFIDKLPMTSIGKVKRFQLRDIALSAYNDK
ncbi:MAG: acyl--CoA ligase [Prevotellaceae bacterium]|jgi:long-chain acyl-CoA synthetase|nr:acyl--CoA ligase [Prevotellaceae bacterium]